MKLAPFESRWAEAAMQTIYPGSLDIGLSDIRAMDVGKFLCELMIHLPWKAALGLRLAHRGRNEYRHAEAQRHTQPSEAGGCGLRDLLEHDAVRDLLRSVGLAPQPRQI